MVKGEIAPRLAEAAPVVVSLHYLLAQFLVLVGREHQPATLS
jgi:hypothetical protein